MAQKLSTKKCWNKIKCIKILINIKKNHNNLVVIGNLYNYYINSIFKEKLINTQTFNLFNKKQF